MRNHLSDGGGAQYRQQLFLCLLSRYTSFPKCLLLLCFASGSDHKFKKEKGKKPKTHPSQLFTFLLCFKSFQTLASGLIF